MLQQDTSRGKGFEIPDALKLFKRLDVKGKVVTADAKFCQKTIAVKIVARGGDYILPIKDNQKILREAVQTAFNEPISRLASPIAASRRPMAASSGVESMCCRRKPPALRTNGRWAAKITA